ncbi:hypothetical protein WJX81_008342 [Elliptochloris bilobata]|uniref:Uncharacterized protein n=1 Tax=Elliptochloris bilobata TaxID=381761 RepID=A0AAW1RFW4_9CHLO
MRGIGLRQPLATPLQEQALGVWGQAQMRGQRTSGSKPSVALPMSASCNPSTPAKALPRSDSADASLRSAATAAAGEIAALETWAGTGAGAADSEDDGDSPASKLRLLRPPLHGRRGRAPAKRCSSLLACAPPSAEDLTALDALPAAEPPCSLQRTAAKPRPGSAMMACMLMGDASDSDASCLTLPREVGGDVREAAAAETTLGTPVGAAAFAAANLSAGGALAALAPGHLALLIAASGRDVALAQALLAALASLGDAELGAVGRALQALHAASRAAAAAAGAPSAPTNVGPALLQACAALPASARTSLAFCRRMLNGGAAGLTPKVMAGGWGRVVRAWAAAAELAADDTASLALHLWARVEPRLCAGAVEGLGAARAWEAAALACLWIAAKAEEVAGGTAGTILGGRPSLL